MPSFVIKQIATPDPMLEGTEEALSRAINTSNRNFDVVKRLLYGQVDSVNIRENSIQADRMDVNDLTAITATFSELKAGSTFDYMYLYSAEGKPYIDIFSDDTKRLSIQEDAINFYTEAGELGGFILGEETDTGIPSVSVITPWQTRLMSIDPNVELGTRYALIYTDSPSGAMDSSPMATMYTYDEEGDSPVSSGINISENIVMMSQYGSIALTSYKNGVGLYTTHEDGNIALEADHGMVGIVAYDNEIALTSYKNGVGLYTTHEDGNIALEADHGMVGIVAYDNEVEIVSWTDDVTIGSLLGDVNLNTPYGETNADIRGTINGWDIQKNGTDGSGIINFKCE
jgi:hypothetical protein